MVRTLPRPDEPGEVTDGAAAMANDQDSADEGRSLSAAMSQLALHLQKSFLSTEDTMREITTAAVSMVAAAEDASISLIVRSRTVESRAATSDLPRRIDALQHELGEGPCVDAVWEHRTVSVADLSDEPRWPQFAPAAASEGVGSMLSFQLYTDGENLGALNLFSPDAGAFGDNDEDHGALVATHAAIALMGAEHERRFQSALASRDVIGQAKGMIMERYGLGAVAAFEMLRTLSQQMNVPVAELAVRVTEQATRAGPGGRASGDTESVTDAMAAGTSPPWWPHIGDPCRPVDAETHL